MKVIPEPMDQLVAATGGNQSFVRGAGVAPPWAAREGCWVTQWGKGDVPCGASCRQASMLVREDVPCGT